MKKAIVKSVVRAVSAKVTSEERLKAELLMTRRQLWADRMQATNEAKGFIAANAELATFEKELSEKYDVKAPLDIGEDGTLSTART